MDDTIKSLEVDLSKLGLSDKEQEAIGQNIAKTALESLANIDNGFKGTAIFGKLDPGHYGLHIGDDIQVLVKHVTRNQNL